jgi:hypothetical protein
MNEARQAAVWFDDAETEIAGEVDAGSVGGDSRVGQRCGEATVAVVGVQGEQVGLDPDAVGFNEAPG